MPSESLKPLPDWGLLYTADYILPRYKWYRKTNQFPNGLGYDAQPKALLEAFQQLDYLVQWWQEKLLREQKPKG